MTTDNTRISDAFTHEELVDEIERQLQPERQDQPLFLAVRALVSKPRRFRRARQAAEVQAALLSLSRVELAAQLAICMLATGTSVSTAADALRLKPARVLASVWPEIEER